jgi:hypothetical protein
MDQEHRDYADPAPPGLMPMYHRVVLIIALAAVFGGYALALRH